MARFLERVDIPGTGTFFCTQTYECLSSSTHELAPHVTLREGADWDEALREMRGLFPDAVGWRSHSCVFSHLLAEQLWRLGYRYVSVHDELDHPRPEPRRHAWGLWQLPIYYMDNLDFSAPRFWSGGHETFRRATIEQAVSGDGLYVFDFHPVHLTLNSPSVDEYFARRPLLAEGRPVDEIAYAGRGARTFYDELCSAMHDSRNESVAMRDALARYDDGPKPREAG